MWAVHVSHSNTYSKRERYVKELQKYINVDIFGECGQECPKVDNQYFHEGNRSEDCFDSQMRKHKFYLAFEVDFKY